MTPDTVHCARTIGAPRASGSVALHACWAGGLCLWAEDAARAAEVLAISPGSGSNGSADVGEAGEPSRQRVSDEPMEHPYAPAAEAVRALLTREAPGVDLAPCEVQRLTLRLPSGGGVPAPSPHTAHMAGLSTVDLGAREDQGAELARWSVDALILPAHTALALLEAWEQREGGGEVFAERDARFFLALWRLARALVAQGRVVPMLVREEEGSLRARWHAWVRDEGVRDRLADLLDAMPPAARALEAGVAASPWTTLEDALHALVDAQCRRILAREELADALAGRDASDPHVAWLRALLDANDAAAARGELAEQLIRGARRWLGRLEDQGEDTAWRLLLRVEAPELDVFDAPPAAAWWRVSFHLEPRDGAGRPISASDIWRLPLDQAIVEGRRLDQPHDLLLAELDRAARLSPLLEPAMRSEHPEAIEITAAQAQRFLREERPLLLEQGVGVAPPAWWGAADARLGARAVIEPIVSVGDGEAQTAGAGQSAPAPEGFARSDGAGGLERMVRLEWRLAIGDTPVSMTELERWTRDGSPFVRFEDRWIELLPEDIEAARELLKMGQSRDMPLREAIGVALGAGRAAAKLPIVGVEVRDWLEEVLARQPASRDLAQAPQPASFHGELRAYQVAGLSWLAFLEGHGLGGCLADDMGLGKTIQIIALLLHEREMSPHASGGTGVSPVATQEKGGTGVPPVATQEKGGTGVPPVASDARAGETPAPPPMEEKRAGGAPAPPGRQADSVGPSLLIVPTSVVSNWLREMRRFAPSLKTMAHHGPDRLRGDAFARKAQEVDAVVTTYALAHRDVEDLSRVRWRRVVLDEAQKIKNPDAKQAKAVRAIPAQTRLALTGTPVENHLTDLWSIMDFCNPGLLGPLESFRRTIAAPIERNRDETRRRRLRAIIQPFLLRRVKSDPAVEIDLPEKIETREHCALTLEQASLYERAVEETLSGVDAASGVRRRGLILAGLTRLKQICNHPAQALGDPPASAGADPGFAQRSGKCARLLEMLEEVLEEGDQAILFSQYRVMAEMLAALLRRQLDRDVLLLHGGTPREQRQRLVDRFQRSDGSAPVLVLSLKAGGLGMNLTAANHVFHFDRWWNPAVESQATDRAHRIGQTRTVHVHKFVVAGTLEERIDEMLEAKKDLAARVVGAGEQWITELSTDQLRDVLTLRKGAIDAADDAGDATGAADAADAA